jgi:acetyl-CoA carboxylase biotin carboxyl carrier protein
MDIRKVKKLIELLEESGVSEIEIKEGEESVRISRHPTGVMHAFSAPPAYAMPPPAAAAVAPAGAAGSPPAARSTRRLPRGPGRSSRSAPRSSPATCCASSRP